jgi:hypothetical protein
MENASMIEVRRFLENKLPVGADSVDILQASPCNSG